MADYTHVFVEIEIAQKLRLEHDPYDVGDCKAAIISKADGLKLLLIYQKLLDEKFAVHIDRVDVRRLTPKIFPSCVDGIGVLISYHITNDMFIDILTDGRSKDTDLYTEIMKINSGERFIHGEVRNKIATMYEDIGKVTPEPVPAQAVPVANDEIKTKFIDEMKKNFVATFVTKTSPKGNHVFHINDEHKFSQEDLFNIADSLNKSILITKCEYEGYVKKMNKDFLAKHFIIMFYGCGGDNKFSSLTNSSFKDTVCLGQYIDESSVIKINEGDGKSPYAEYDSIMKDVSTNILFALRKNNYVYLMAGVRAGNNHQAFYKKITAEIIRRWDNNIPYEQLFEIDMGYQKGVIQDDREKYIKFAMENSHIYIKKIRTALEQGINEIGKLQKELAEKMKMYNQYVEIIECFDEKKHSEEARAKAMEAFDGVMKMPQVKCVFAKENKIHVYTNDLYAVDERDKKIHNIGTFHIQLNMMSPEYNQNESIVIKNTKHTVAGYSGVMEAPHIFNGGHMCHGNLLQTVIESYANRDLYAIINALVIFIESANTADMAGQYVSKWPIAKPEEVKKEAVKDETDDELSKFLAKP